LCRHFALVSGVVAWRGAYLFFYNCFVPCLCSLLLCENPFPYCSHKQYRYIDVEVRIVKTDTLTMDVMKVRLYSYCSVVSEQNALSVGAYS